MDEPIAPPSPMLLALEGRAWLEFAALVPALPALAGAPRGDGHPVLVLPGFLADDGSTRALRWFLRDRGYHAHASRLGRNTGPTPETVGGLVERLAALYERHARKVSLVGWSLGGIYARELARAFPDRVRSVITLASPFRDPSASNVARLARLGFGPRPAGDTRVPHERLRAPLPVPTTSFYSETDGIVAWQSCLADEGPLAENLAVASSHCGMGHHPTVLLTIAERLAQPEGTWRPYVPRASGWWPFAPVARGSEARPAPSARLYTRARRGVTRRHSSAPGVYMAPVAYDRLGFLDNSFLIAESPTNHMHIAGTATYEIGPLRTPEGGVDIDRIRDYVLSRLHRIPRYRQVLLELPIDGHPAWVDDQHFNVHYHVRHTSLPRPGDERQLKRLSGRIMSQQLDRSKPLWEMWIVEGLDGGDRFAVITKVHHCMIDGMSSVDLLEVLLMPRPTDTIEPPPRWVPRPVPSRWDLLQSETLRRVRAPFETVAGLRSVIADAGDPRSNMRAMLRAVRDTVGLGLRRCSDTPLNKPIGPHRRFDWLAMSVADVKAVKNALGGSLNDIVLATVSGAVREFLAERRVSVEGEFRVMTPVSVRAREERGTLGNRVSAWIVDLPITERDPRRSIARIREATAKLKESKQAIGADLLTQAVAWTPSTLLSLGSRMVMRALPFNLVVTNVPGPQVPLYLLGARMLDNYGQVPLTDYLGLGIVIFSYAGRLCWGFNADWDLVPDLHAFVRATETSFRELCMAAGVTPGARAAGPPTLPLRPPQDSIEAP